METTEQLKILVKSLKLYWFNGVTVESNPLVYMLVVLLKKGGNQQGFYFFCLVIYEEEKVLYSKILLSLFTPVIQGNWAIDVKFIILMLYKRLVA
jgi:hypothetical protein